MFLKNFPIFFENTPTFFENLKVFLQYVRIRLHTYGDTSLHGRTHKPTRIYASGYTDVRISLHVYMSLCQAPYIFCAG